MHLILLVENEQVVETIAPYLYLKSFCWFLAISICSSELNLTLAAVNAASNIHKSLLNNVFRQPMQFFDIAPVGRILCRFSTDVCTVDQELSFNMYEVIESGCVVCHINTLMAVIFKLYDHFLSLFFFNLYGFVLGNVSEIIILFCYGLEITNLYYFGRLKHL